MTVGILLVCLGVYLSLVLVGCAVQDALIFPRSIANATPMGATPSGVEVVAVETEPGVRVEGWVLRGQGRSEASPGPAVVFFHGNAERIDNCLDHARQYQARGFTVLLPEYRGYGSSGGRPSQQGIVRDMTALVALLAERPEVDPDHIVYHGRSLGGAVAVQVAVAADARSPRAMVLESTFTSISSFASRYLMPSFVVRHPFRTDRVLGEIDAPILLLHGEADRIVPVSHSRKLAELSSRASLVVMPGGHNDFPHDWDAYWREIDGFLSKPLGQ